MFRFRHHNPSHLFKPSHLYAFSLFKSKPKTFYEILGVNQRASPTEIKAAYFNLVKKYHPDQNKESDAEDKFKELVKAYESLKDPVKRQLYDLGNTGTAGGFNYNQAGQGFSGGGSDTSTSYYEKQEQPYYDNKWYQYQKPTLETQREEYEELKIRFQKMDQAMFYLVIRRTLLIVSIYAAFDLYKTYSNNRHTKFLNTQVELLHDQLEVKNQDLNEYINERQEEWDTESQV